MKLSCDLESNRTKIPRYYSP